MNEGTGKENGTDAVQLADAEHYADPHAVARADPHAVVRADAIAEVVRLPGEQSRRVERKDSLDLRLPHLHQAFIIALCDLLRYSIYLIRFLPARAYQYFSAYRRRLTAFL